MVVVLVLVEVEGDDEGDMWVRYIFCPSVAAKRGISSWRSGEARPAMWVVVVIGWCRINVRGNVPL